MRLYDLTEQYKDLLELLESDADNEQLQAMLEGMEGKIADKIDAVLCIRSEKKSEAKALLEESKRLMERAASFEKEAERLEELVERTLATAGLDKLKTTRFTAWMQNNPPSVIVTDESALPQEYFVPQPSRVDKKRLLDDLKSGAFTLHNVACISQARSLRVR